MSNYSQNDYKALQYKCYEIKWLWRGNFAGEEIYHGWFRNYNAAYAYASAIARARTRDGMLWEVDNVKESEGECI